PAFACADAAPGQKFEVDFSIRRYRARFCISTPKLTLASGATALGSAWRASLIYQTHPRLVFELISAVAERVFGLTQTFSLR
ncbi:MAG TPA: hypothetical protein VGJ66_22810, partial [Pyrinomonadaceae bacterium]